MNRADMAAWRELMNQSFAEVHRRGPLVVEHGTATLRSQRALRRCLDRATFFGQELYAEMRKRYRAALISKRLTQLSGEQITSDFGARLRAEQPAEHGQNLRTRRLP